MKAHVSRRLASSGTLSRVLMQELQISQIVLYKGQESIKATRGCSDARSSLGTEQKGTKGLAVLGRGDASACPACCCWLGGGAAFPPALAVALEIRSGDCVCVSAWGG